MDAKVIKILFKSTLLKDNDIEGPLIIEFGENVGSIYIDENIDDFLKAIDKFIDNDGTFEDLINILDTYACDARNNNSDPVDHINEIPFNNILENPIKITNIETIANYIYAMV